MTKPSTAPMRAMSKQQSEPWRRIIRASRAVVVGWCVLCHPEIDPMKCELLFDFKSDRKAFYVVPSNDNTPDDTFVGPYGIEDGVRFGMVGIAVLATAAIMTGGAFNERIIAGDWFW